MKLDLLTNKTEGYAGDEWYTPAYAIRPLLKYLSEGTVWCPFDTEESNYVKLVREKGLKCINTHLSTGQDFFTYFPEERVDYIISNPPYSKKYEVFQRLFDLGIPFAMLIGEVGVFESKKRFEMFRDNTFEIMHFNKRIVYFRDQDDFSTVAHPPFSSIYMCQGILPKPHVFEEVVKGV